MNSRVCCQGVNWLKFTVPSPQTVIALTELYNASMYAMGYLPLDAYRMTEQIRGVNVLEEMTVKQGSLLRSMCEAHKKSRCMRKKLRCLFRVVQNPGLALEPGISPGI